MKHLSLVYYLVGLAFLSYGQSGRVSGMVTEGTSNQVVSGAKIEVKSKTTGAVVNRVLSESNGSFQLTALPYGDYRFTVTLISFDTIIKEVKINKPELTLTIKMTGSLEFDEVRVIGNVVKDGPVPVAVTKISTQKNSRGIRLQGFTHAIKWNSWSVCYPIRRR